MRIPPQILIVDDNTANLDIFATRLAAHGYDIITASDGAEGLALAMEHKPDLILLDIMMPKTSLGSTSDLAGTSKTSSKVKASWLICIVAPGGGRSKRDYRVLPQRG